MYRRKESSKIKFFYLAIIFFIIGFVANNYISTGLLFPEKKPKIPGAVLTQNPEKVSLNLFWEVWNEVEKNYLIEENIDYEKMIYGAIRGMVNSLGDPYTVFMDPIESKEFLESLDGTLEGIGAELTVEDGNLKIVTPLKNSPAEKAGLKPNDIIFKINEDFANDFTLFEAITKIRGPKGSTVELSILRTGLSDPIIIEITRDSIVLDSVTFEKLEEEIYYISINQFSDTTYQDFLKIISTNDLVVKKPKGLIIDLRYNGGGYLSSAVNLLSIFLPDKTEAVIIRQKDKNDEVLYTRGLPKLSDIPLVVLLNEGSASASEIMAGALRDYEKAIIMGVKSFGKGTVQEVEHFRDLSSIRLTIAKWLTPKGTDINETGLFPDIEVEIKEEDYENKFDRQKDEALKYLKNINTR
jgi:carboxyl-terminal processing protease